MLFVCACAASFAGCERHGIQVYRVAKEPVAGSAPTPATPVPAGWEQAPPGEMRVASFRVKGSGGKMADVSVIPLPGQAGRDLDNVNRWRGQVALAPITEAELGKLAEQVQIGGAPGQLYDLAGENTGSGDKTRMLAAILRKEGVAWFFKMTGDATLVAEQKPAFLEYLKTFQFPGAQVDAAGSTPQPDLPAGHPPLGGATSAPTVLPSDHPPIGASSGLAVAPAPSAGKPNWNIPTGWRETEAGQFLVAKFLITGANSAQAAVNVSMSAGNGGGVLLNVNRWRKQLGLNDLDETGAQQLATPLDASGVQAMLIDMAGVDPRNSEKTRLLAAIVPLAGQTWFYKLMGPIDVVEAQKDTFIKFVQSTKYPQ